ncbi:hypothetical protein PHAVU_004G155201 [Phaseolus vulgaris]
MFRTLTLFFLFSVTATLLLPTKSDVNFNTSSMLLAQNHSKTLNKVGDDVFMACDDRKNCRSNNSVDNQSAHVARRLDSLTNFTSNPNMTLDDKVIEVVSPTQNHKHHRLCRYHRHRHHHMCQRRYHHRHLHVDHDQQRLNHLKIQVTTSTHGQLL